MSDDEKTDKTKQKQQSAKSSVQLTDQQQLEEERLRQQKLEEKRLRHQQREEERLREQQLEEERLRQEQLEEERLRHQQLEEERLRQQQRTNMACNLKPPKSLTVRKDQAQEWKQWIQQFKWYSCATQLTEKPAEVQAATFMTAIGSEAAAIYNTFGLDDQEQINVKVIEKKFEEYFMPKSNVIFERYTFNEMTQNDGESFDEFLTKIKTQAKKCEYGELVDSLIRDKIVTGIRSKAVREKLLPNGKLTLDEAIETCKAHEVTTQQMHKYKGTTKTQ